MVLVPVGGEGLLIAADLSELSSMELGEVEGGAGFIWR